MPHKGFSSITIKESVYNKFYNVFKATKKSTVYNDSAESFAGYVTKCIERSMLESSTKLRFILIHFQQIENDAILILKDRMDLSFTIEVEATHGVGLWCKKCKKEFCIHTGFCYSLWQIYPIINSGKNSE